LLQSRSWFFRWEVSLDIINQPVVNRRTMKNIHSKTKLGISWNIPCFRCN
jgi:hypothetical protein